jgi:hypothetical protein
MGEEEICEPLDLTSGEEEKVESFATFIAGISFDYFLCCFFQNIGDKLFVS